MSAWSFLSKAEGFLDRVLEEQSKEKGAQQKRGGSDAAIKVGEPSRSSTPKWQERLTRAASQFKSTDSLTNLASNRSSIDANEKPLVAPHKLTEKSSSVQLISNAATTTSDAINHDEDQPEPLTELQMSCIFPPNMPSRLEDVLKHLDKFEPPDPTTNSTGDELQGDSPSIDSNRSERTAAPLIRPSVELSRSLGSTDPSSADFSGLSHNELLTLAIKLQEDLAACEARRIDENHVNAERISSLESRLSYLSNERVIETRETSRAAGVTAEQKIIAERDERIALLLSEGDSLSKKELQHLANLKKLRGRITDLEGLIATSLKAVEKADSESTTMRREIKTLQETIKQDAQRLKEMQKLENEVVELRREKQVQSKAVSELKRQLADADDTISQNITIWTQLQSEKAKTDALQKRISELLSEAKTTTEEFAAESGELQGRLDRLAERSRVREAEKDEELTRLSSELENTRAMLEEATTGAMETNQTKFLRQIESLQTQQSLARQNWARIEESLVLRSTHAEKERDELRLQEDELRNRLRQTALQRKEIEEERATAQSRCRQLENTVRDLQEQITAMEKLQHNRESEWERQKSHWALEKETLAASVEEQIKTRVEEERHSYHVSSPQSPYMQDTAGRSAFSFQRHIVDSPNSRTAETVKRPGMNSRMSTQSSRMPRRRNPSGQSALDELRSPPESTREEDPFHQFEGSVQLRAPTEASLSTVSAGASMGMMERVTANVRKLELEMNILREDLSRMTRQRDEARETCVAMEEVLAERRRLETEQEEARTRREKLERRFEATLELLGEQTEENEQLREDIADMKAAFRETLEGLSRSPGGAGAAGISAGR